MSLDLVIVLGLLACATVMFVAGRPRADGVALLMLTALPLSGILTVQEALAGFSDPSVILIAAFFVIGEALVRTGIARRLGDWLSRRAGGNSTRLLVLLMLIVATLGSVMSSTGVVAIFVPIVAGLSIRTGIAKSRLMMPLSVAALISGMTTLVATAPNLVVNSELQREGYAGFGFFSFTPFGLPILLLGIAYMLLVRPWLSGIPAGEADTAAGRPGLRDLSRLYGLEGRVQRLQVQPDSPCVNRRLEALRMRARHGVNVFAIVRHTRSGEVLLSPDKDTVLRAGDILLVDQSSASGDPQAVPGDLHLPSLPLDNVDFATRPQAVGMVEIIITPDSDLLGRSFLSSGFRTLYGLTVIGLRRGQEAFRSDYLQEKLQVGDAALVVGPWKMLRGSQMGRRNFLLLSQPRELEELSPAAKKAPYALLGLGVTIVLMVTGLVPHVLAAFIGCLAMIGFRCLGLEHAYRSIHWQSIMLIVGMMPFSAALQKTGAIGMAAEGLIQIVGGGNPHLLLAALFAATAVTGLFISNTATAILMAPIAIATARELDFSPYPFAMIVALASSAAFMTPVSSPVNTLVMAAGNYRFSDFVRVGVPFTAIVMAVSILLVPLLLPFRS